MSCIERLTEISGASLLPNFNARESDFCLRQASDTRLHKIFSGPCVRKPLSAGRRSEIVKRVSGFALAVFGEVRTELKLDFNTPL